MFPMAWHTGRRGDFTNGESQQAYVGGQASRQRLATPRPWADSPASPQKPGQDLPPSLSSHQTISSPSYTPAADLQEVWRLTVGRLPVNLKLTKELWNIGKSTVLKKSEI